jgi:protein-disulfide isomerase
LLRDGFRRTCYLFAMIRSSHGGTVKYRNNLVQRLTLGVALASGALAGCSSEERAPDSASAASAAAMAAPPVLPDSIDATTDSILRVADASRIAGNSNANVWLIVMSDFQCPVCRQYHESAYAQIKKDYLDKGLIRIAYVNAPRPYHAHGRVTAERALCAGLQGKFWEYHDELFRTQESWSLLPAGTPYFDSLATMLKLDMNNWDQCVKSGVMSTMVTADEIRSKEAGEAGSPSFLIGGVKVVGLQPYNVFKRYLDAAIAASSRATGSGKGRSGT